MWSKSMEETTIFIVSYVRKHDDGINAYDNRAKAEAGVMYLMEASVNSWDTKAKAEFYQLESFAAKYEFFQRIEAGFSGSVTIKIFERLLH